jgi:2,4-dienoyl-CoA reductase (NADPH2)
VENRHVFYSTDAGDSPGGGHDFHLQVKINAVDFNNALFPWEKKGNTLEESIQICKMVEAAGADAIHVSIGSIFPHPLLPPGGFPG